MCVIASLISHTIFQYGILCYCISFYVRCVPFNMYSILSMRVCMFTLLYSLHFLNKPFTLYVFSSFHKLTSIVFTATADYYCSLSIVFTTTRDYYCSLSIVQVKQVGHKHMK